MPPASHSRTGFCYYPDSLHYRASDLQTWLPRLQALGAGWLVLSAPAGRAIPEPFLAGLLAAGVQPILHFKPPLKLPPAWPWGGAADGVATGADAALLFEQYARWGVRYAALFDRPNLRCSWPPAAWGQADLVERFIDSYAPLAEQARQAGLTPVFPPLEPGGDYWDTTFLTAALRSLRRRGQHDLLQSLVLGAYAWVGHPSGAGLAGSPLNWGAGGPERWPLARPYGLPPGSQDQRGFRIFDWYLALAETELGRRPALICLGSGARLAGLPAHSSGSPAPAPAIAHAQRNLALARLLAGEAPQEVGGEEPPAPLPDEVLACNFWLLAAEANQPEAQEAWYQPDGTPLPVVNALRQWAAIRSTGGQPEAGLPEVAAAQPAPAPGSPRPIAHYLLLPLYAWGVADWDLEAIRPFLQRHHPTVGFSLEEACLAERVTIAGECARIPPQALARLQQAGCQVEALTD